MGQKILILLFFFLNVAAVAAETDDNNKILDSEAIRMPFFLTDSANGTKLSVASEITIEQLKLPMRQALPRFVLQNKKLVITVVALTDESGVIEIVSIAKETHSG